MTTPSAQTPQQGGFEMTIPGQVSNRRDDVKTLEQGPNVGILYSMIDLGTHYNEHFQKSSRLLRLTWEFPLLMQLFKTDDTELRPTIVSTEETFQMAERSNLKKIVDGALGRILQPHEYKDGYKIGQFLGKTMIVNIGHKPSKKDPSRIFERIQSVQGLTEHVRNSYAFDWSLIHRTNDLQGFLIDPNGACFQSDQFAKLPGWLREKIQQSDEAKAYVARGGTFIAKADYQGNQGNQGNVAQAPASAPQATQRVAQALPTAPPPLPPAPQGLNLVTGANGMQFEWLDQGYDYSAYKGQGYNDEQLVTGGQMKVYVAPVPLPPPLPPVQAAVPMPPPPPVPMPAPAPVEDFSTDTDGIAF